MRTCLTAIASTTLLALVFPSGLATASDGENAKVYYDTGTQLRTDAGLTGDRDLKRSILTQSGEAFLKSADGLPAEQAQKALLEAIESFRQVPGEDALARIIMVTFLIEKRFANTDTAAKALVARGEVYISQKEWGRAVAAWLKIYKDYPSSEGAAEALYKSGQLFVERIKNSEEAIRVFSLVVKDYPKSPLADAALFARAEVKEDTKDYAGAVEDYLLLPESYPESKVADKAMYQAIYLCEKNLKEFKKAHELCIKFRKAYPHSGFLKKVESIEQKTLKYVG